MFEIVMIFWIGFPVNGDSYTYHDSSVRTENYKTFNDCIAGATDDSIKYIVNFPGRFGIPKKFSKPSVVEWSCMKIASPHTSPTIIIHRKDFEQFCRN